MNSKKNLISRIYEMHLRQPAFTYIACGPSKFKETGYSWYIYQNELDKACFQHDMAYTDFKCLIKRTNSDEILHDKAFW